MLTLKLNKNPLCYTMKKKNVSNIMTYEGF